MGDGGKLWNDESEGGHESGYIPQDVEGVRWRGGENSTMRARSKKRVADDQRAACSARCGSRQRQDPDHPEDGKMTMRWTERLNRTSEWGLAYNNSQGPEPSLLGEENRNRFGNDEIYKGWGLQAGSKSPASGQIFEKTPIFLTIDPGSSWATRRGRQRTPPVAYHSSSGVFWFRVERVSAQT